ncbi:MAG: M14 family zinc carboxypeptidase [Crocinitomicaceae bacterium]
MKAILFFSVVISSFLSLSQDTTYPYERNQSFTYEEVHQAYRDLVTKYPKHCKLIQFGSSDQGENITLFLIHKDGKFQKEDLKDKAVLLINNAIHPGEPCGVDACVKLSEDLLADAESIPENVVIAIIPMYNVGGAMNRNCCSRANQNGPEMYGFRGNAKNLDLNRDFIKADSRNTRIFYKIYHFLNPHVFVDTHTSNGADYQHVMTLITSQKDKMHPSLKAYTLKALQPHLFAEMEKEGFPMVPYVHQLKKIPDDGIIDYLETPRYSTGYTNLFNTIGFVTETHMLKPFQQRVEATYTFLELLIRFMDKNSEDLISLKEKADDHTAKDQKQFPLHWKLDTTTYELITFHGYEAEYKKSPVTGLDRLFYNRDKPWSKKIKYYNKYIPLDSVSKPNYYIIPQAWQDVIVRLQLNDIRLYRLNKDKKVEVEVYYIDDYQTSGSPYEGHYLHRDIKVSKQIKEINYVKGDYVVPTESFDARFLIETLEPHSVDSYFAWNYFDAILQQKEWFSAYVFEDKAREMLEQDPELKQDFEEKKKSDKEFANSSFAQLYFIYKRSDNYERTHNRYPVTRFMGDFKADEIKEASFLIGG